MQTLYKVVSTHAIPELRVDARYSWFIYKRNNPVLPYEVAIQGYHEVEYQHLCAMRELNGTQNMATALTTYKAAREMIDELFTLAEASQLQSLLAIVHPQIITMLEEAALPVAMPRFQTASSVNNISASGSFVQPEDFADLTGHLLDFQVGATIIYLTHYTAEDFLSRLSPARLAALRKLHAEGEG